MMDQYWMEQALACVERGPKSAYPNPRVGCVVVKDGVLVGEGFHAGAGQPHAEVLALEMAGERAIGATCYVTLEPCNHQGRTGPCTQALIRAKVARVVYAASEPNPVASGGLAVLAAANIQITGPTEEVAAIALNRGFFSIHRRKRPWVIAKLAMSLDGRTALSNGNSRWISSPAARQQVHAQRAASDTILTTAQTVCRDNARLDVRLPGFMGPWPHRVIVDTQGRMPLDAPIWQTSGKVTVLSGTSYVGRWGNTVGTVVLPVIAGKMEMPAIFDWLSQSGSQQVWIEAGATFVGAALAAGYVDMLQIYIAPKLLGHLAKPLMLLPDLETMAEATTLTWHTVEQVGPDLCVSAWVGEGVRCLQG